ncbi:cell division protein FtsX [Sphingobacteriaceae bacterium]|nr:cell division protein FtsX [Sphingobacteriaceae bacterium]
MLKNYIKIAWRNIIRNKLFSSINIIGLSISIACCSIIYLYVSYELSYDDYNEKADRLFRLVTSVKEPKKLVEFARTSPPVADRVKYNFPEVSAFTRFSESQRQISYKGKKIPDTKILYADSSLFEMFSLGLLEGDAHRALANPYNIVITQSMAKRYFGDEPAFGKMIQLADTVNLMVTGIMKDIPKNSHFTTDCFISSVTRNDLFKNDPNFMEGEKAWLNCNIFSYILIKEHTNPQILEKKINAMLEKEMADINKQVGLVMHIKMQPVTDIHLKSHMDTEFPGIVKGDITYVYIFSGAALLILLIACCNFINLSTARSLNRSKEIGLRKVVGAERSQLISQFLGESLVFTSFASLISFLIVLISIPFYNTLLGIPLTLSLDLLWLNLSIILGVGILAGLYPALLMSSFAPVQSLKGKISHGWSDIFLRKGLVVFQFTIAIILIIGTTLILNQLEFIQNRNIGMNKDQILNLKLKPQDADKATTILNELKKNSKVVQGSVNNFSFKGIGYQLMTPEGFKDGETASSYVIFADENFIKTYQMNLVAGRNFSRDFASDAEQAVIVNEAAVKEFGWKNPKDAIGKKLDLGGERKVVGVLKNFNFASLHDEIKPLVMGYTTEWGQTISVRLKTENLNATLKELEATWKTVATQSPFDTGFLEEDFDSLYHTEKNIRNVLSAFTFLSVLVACLGLFGLASFTIKQRFKEIGIRKVLGSSVQDIVKLISKDFLKLVVISFVIASPIAWYLMNKWLQDYAFRIDIGFWVFIIAGLLAFVIALMTVGLQAAKAALVNPVKSLRTDS